MDSLLLLTVGVWLDQSHNFAVALRCRGELPLSVWPWTSWLKCDETAVHIRASVFCVYARRVWPSRRSCDQSKSNERIRVGRGLNLRRDLH